MNPPLQLRPALASDAPAVAAVLQEVAQWLHTANQPLWAALEVGTERITHDVAAGRYHLAQQGGEVVGVMRLDLEDPYFWPEIEAGSSLFVHKLAVRRAWAGQGIAARLLQSAQAQAQSLGRAWLRLDCVADRAALRALYDRLGFRLHSEVERGHRRFARYERLA